MTTDDPRPFRHVGTPVSVEGVPFGATYQDGDYYVSDAPLTPDDVDVADEVRRLRAENEALRAMVDACREIVAENHGDFDGERPIDHVTCVVGYPQDGSEDRREERG